MVSYTARMLKGRVVTDCPIVKQSRPQIVCSRATSHWHLRGQHCRAYAASTQTVEADAPGLRPEPWRGTTEQEQALRTLRARFSSSLAPPSDEILQWYLRDRYFDIEEAEQKLRSMLKWRQNFRPELITAESVAREYASGKAYVHSHTDVFGRPAIVIRCQRHKTGEYPIEDSKRLCVHLIDKAVQQAKADGREQIIGIFDLRGFQVPENADFGFARFMIEAFFEYYPRRVGQVLFVDAPWVFQPAWVAIRPLMRKYAALVRFISTDELRREFFTSSTVPSDFKQ